MNSITSTWFECAVKYERTNEEGAQISVTETYVVEALSFSEAEAKIIKEMAPYTSGDLEVKKISPTSYHELFFSDLDQDDKWYKANLSFITIDEKSGKEKKSPVTFLVQASSLETALSYVAQEMVKTAIDYLPAIMSETKIMDVFKH